MANGHLFDLYHYEFQYQTLFVYKEQFLRAELKELQFNMMVANKINGLISLELEEYDGNCRLRYQFQQKKPLDSYLKGKALTHDELIYFLISLLKIIQANRVYMLNESYYLLQPQLIMIGHSLHEIGLVYLPIGSYQSNFFEEFRKLVFFLIKTKGIDEKECYLLYQLLFQEKLSLQQLLGEIESIARDRIKLDKVKTRKKAIASNPNTAITQNDSQRNHSPRTIIPKLEQNRNGSSASFLTSSYFNLKNIMALFLIVNAFIILFFQDQLPHHVWLISLSLEVMIGSMLIFFLLKKRKNKLFVETHHESNNHLVYEPIPNFSGAQSSIQPSTYSNAHSSTHSSPNANVHPSAYSSPNANVHPSAYSSPNANVHSSAYSSTNANVYSDEFLRDHSNTYANAYLSDHSNAHPSTYANTYSGEVSNIHQSNVSSGYSRASMFSDHTVFLDMSDETVSLQDVFNQNLPFTSQPLAKIIRRYEGKDEEIQLIEHPFVIGRKKERCQQVEDYPGISRTHLEIFLQKEMFMLKDLGSRNGTFLNGEKIIPFKAYLLKEHDKIKLSQIEYTFLPLNNRS